MRPVAPDGQIEAVALSTARFVVGVHPVDKRGRIVQVEGTWSCHTLRAEHRHGELMPELTDRVPKQLDDADAQWADLVVTMGCGDACPVLPGKRYVDWELDDPAGRPIDEVRGRA